MTRPVPVLALLIFAAAPALAGPARADYLTDQQDGCAQPLTPASRAAIIEACGKVLQLGELPASIQGPAFVARGNAYGFAANFPKAMADFSTAIDIDSKNPAPLAARGVTLMKQKKFEDAVSDFNAALRLDAANAMALYGRGLAAHDAGQDGAADMAKAVALDPVVAQFYADNGLAP
jgi:Flp pilus assembly protein TadD